MGFQSSFSSPHLKFTHLHFYWVAASVDTSRSPVGIGRSPVDTSRSPRVAGVALDGTGWRVVQLFHYTNIGVFLLVSTGERRVQHWSHSNKCRDRLHWRLKRAKHSTNGTKKYGQGKRKIDSDWAENEEGKLEGSKCQH